MIDDADPQPLDPLRMPLWGSRLIEASAGTGKTWTIAALYLRLVLDAGDESARFGVPLAPSRILVMTFTRAATRELVERIRERLVRAARCFRDPRRSDGSDPFVDALIAACPDAAAREVAAWRLSTAAEAMDDAGVFTIDAWVGRMLREHAFDSGSLFDEEMQADETAMLGEAARDYWRQEVYPLRGAAFDDASRAWPTIGHLLADARRIAQHVRLDDDGLSLAEARRPVALRRDATLAAIKDGWSARIGEMHRWLTSQLSSPQCPFNRNRLRAKTVDEWLEALAAWAATPGALEPALKDPAKAWARLAPDGLRDCLKSGCTVVVPAVFDALVALPAALAALEDPTHAMRLHAAARIATRLRTLKERAGVHGFQDLLERLDRALHGPGGERLRARIVEQYPVAMIDEFQDTSPLQYRVFDRLYRTADNARETALLLIGDPKQSIYAFRGADIQSYLQARRATAGRHDLLTTNYRSQPALAAAVNRLFGRAESRRGGAFRFGSAHVDVDVDAPSPLPFVPVHAAGRSDCLRDASGPMTAFLVCHDAELTSRSDAIRRFAERAAEHIATSLNDAQVGFTDVRDEFRRLAPADIAVLVRDRKEAAAIRGALQRRGIASAYLSDQESVFTSREAVDLLDWLRAVAEPLDGRRARVAFATSLIGLSLAELAAMRDDDRVFEMRIDQLRLLHREWMRQGVLPMIRRTLHLLDLPARWLATADGERRLTNVLHLAELMQHASAGHDAGVGGTEALIRWLEEHLAADHRDDEQQVVRLESDADLVKVVTIHKSKGLEYPVVYLPFVCGVRERRWQAGELAFPADADGVRHVEFDASEETRRRIDLEDRQEDLRLLYVALTRARHALWVGVAPIRVGRDPACAFNRSAFGHLLTGGAAVDEHAIAALLEDTFADLPSVALEAIEGDTPCTRLARGDAVAPLVDAAGYAAVFERDWSIASFSSLVRDLARPPAGPMVDPAVEEEIASGPVDEVTEPAADDRNLGSAPRHRFPRGALAGNFLHDQLEWLAGERFALVGDPTLEQELLRRCERQGWSGEGGHGGNQRATDVVTWMREIVTTKLPPLGTSLARVPRILPEMEFWFPSTRLDAAEIDRACRAAWLVGRERPVLPQRALHGMLMGFVDLVCEIDGRYWLIDYKSNALGARDADYDAEAIARSMAEHRYDVQGSIYLLALHRLLARRLGERYDPATQLGGALYLYLRGIEGPVAGCHVMAPDVAWLDAFDALFQEAAAVER